MHVVYWYFTSYPDRWGSYIFRKQSKIFKGHARLIFSMADLWQGNLVQSVGRYVKIKNNSHPQIFSLILKNPEKSSWSVGKKKVSFFNFLFNSMKAIASCNSGVNHVTGRCALFNVKLHFYSSLTIFFWGGGG